MSYTQSQNAALAVGGLLLLMALGKSQQTPSTPSAPVDPGVPPVGPPNLDPTELSIFFAQGATAANKAIFSGDTTRVLSTQNLQQKLWVETFRDFLASQFRVLAETVRKECISIQAIGQVLEGLGATLHDAIVKASAGKAFITFQMAEDAVETVIKFSAAAFLRENMQNTTSTTNSTNSSTGFDQGTHSGPAAMQ